jgi:hypothetical protein
MKRISKNALSSIVSILLLLLIMIGATFSVFTFYKSFSSKYSADLETQINLEKYIDLKYIESNQLYYSNSYSSEITFENLSIIGEDCSLSGILLEGSNNLSLTGCTITSLGTSLQIIISSNEKIYSEHILFKDNY